MSPFSNPVSAETIRDQQTLQRLEQGLVSLMQLISAANPLLQKHIDQIAQAMERDRIKSQKVYAENVLDGRGQRSLIANKGEVRRLLEPVDQNHHRFQKWLTHFLTVEEDGVTKFHPYIPRIGTSAELTTILTNEGERLLSPGVYTDDKTELFALIYKREDIEHLVLLRTGSDLMHIEHQILIEIEGGWIPDPTLRYLDHDCVNSELRRVFGTLLT